MSAEEQSSSPKENQPSVTRIEDILLERLQNEPTIKPQVAPPILSGILIFILALGVFIYFLSRKPETFAEDPHASGTQQSPADSSKLNSKRLVLAPIVDSLSQVLAINPENAEAHLTLANVYYEIEYWDKAEREYEIALKKDPENVDARVDYAFVLTQTTGDFKQAVAEIKKALKYEPEHVNALFNAGILSIRANLDDKKKGVAEATVYFKRAQEAAKKQHNDKMAEQISRVMEELDKMQAESAQP